MKDKARETIQNRIAAVWLTSDPCPFCFDNQPRSEQTKTPWARISLQFGQSAPSTVGREGIRTPATLFVQVFIPENEGTAVAFKVADKLDEALRFQQLTFTEGSKNCSVNGDGGCTGPVPGALSGGFRLYSLMHVLRIDEHNTEV